MNLEFPSGQPLVSSPVLDSFGEFLTIVPVISGPAYFHSGSECYLILFYNLGRARNQLSHLVICQHTFHDTNVCTDNIVSGSPHSLSSLELCSQPYTWQISWFWGSYVEEILWRFHGPRSQGLHLVHPRQMPQQWYLYSLRSAEAAVAPLDSFFPLLKSVFWWAHTHHINQALSRLWLASQGMTCGGGVDTTLLLPCSHHGWAKAGRCCDGGYPREPLDRERCPPG